MRIQRLRLHALQVRVRLVCFKRRFVQVDVRIIVLLLTRLGI